MLKWQAAALLVLVWVQPAQSTERLALMEGPLSLIVTVNGLRCCDGTWRVALYHKDSKWMSESGMVRGRIGSVLADSQRVEIHGLPRGKYAIAVHQDLNGDGKLNRRFGLVPREPYGFSNDVGKYGPASFEEASFELNEDKEISITMH